MSYLLPRAGKTLRTFLYCVQGKGKGVGSPLENKEVHRPSLQTELAQETDKEADGSCFLSSAQWDAPHCSKAQEGTQIQVLVIRMD